jgi:O-antigen ligase
MNRTIPLATTPGAIRDRSTSAERIRELVVGVAACLMFAYPAGKYPPFRQWSNLIALPDSGLPAANPLSQLLNYDSLLIFALALLVTSSGATQIVRRATSSTTRVLALVALLLTAGGLVALPASALVGISIGRLLAYLTVVVFAIVVSQLRLRAAEIRVLMAAAVAGTGLVMAAGLYAFYAAYGVPSSLFSLMYAHFDFTGKFSEYERFTYGSPAQTQEVIMLTLPVCLVMSLAPGIGRAERLFYTGVLSLLLLNSVIDFERWALATIAAVILLLIFRLVLQRRLRALALIASCITALFVLVVVPSLADGRIVQYFSRATQVGQADNVSDRIANWRHGLDAIRANPWGEGFGTELAQAGLPNGVAHNLLIDTWIGGGPLAMAGVLLWLVWYLRAFFRYLRSVRCRVPAPSNEAAFGLYLGAFGLAFYSIIQAVPFYNYGLGVWLAFWLVFPVLAIALTEDSGSGGDVEAPVSSSGGPAVLR